MILSLILGALILFVLGTLLWPLPRTWRDSKHD
jgi:hypothetical protein